MACKKRIICSALCLSLFTGLLLFTLIGLESVIDSVILDGVVLAPDTIDLWGQNPGATNTTLLRNFTFYNLSNPRQFLYRGQKPVFREFTGYLMQERSNFTNLTYSPDRSYIEFNDWRFFTPLPHSRDFNESVHVLNLAPIGFWSQLDNIPLPQLAIQGFGGLFVAINATIKMQAIGQGVQGQYLPNATVFGALCAQLQIESGLCNWLFNDTLYGLGDADNYQVWVDFSYYNNTDSEYLLYKYFNLKRRQLQAFDRIFQRWCYSVERILDNWYCGGHCDNYELTILQLSAAGLTNNPPTGEGTDSICLTPKGQLTQNVSCQGYPQLYSFYKYVFPLIDNSSRFQNLSFSQQTVRQLYSPYNGTLLNVGNLTRLFQVGTAYDASHDKESLQQLRVETHGESDQHAVVIWEYAKYFAYEFVLQSKDKGTKKIAGLGGVFSQALYQSFTQFADWILDELLAIKVAELIPDCALFLKQTVEISSQRASALCANISGEDYRSYLPLIQPCDNEYFAGQFKEENELLAYEMGLLCNLGSPSVLHILRQAHAEIAAHHYCRDSAKCTGHQLALKQFFFSNITRYPLNSTVKQHSESYTGHAWNPELQQWEYRHFLDIAYSDPDLDNNTLNESQLTDLLSFNKLFNGAMVQNLTLLQDPAFFSRLFYFTNKTLLMEYIRFVIIEIGFGGFTQKRTVNELLFGYQDPFLQTLKEMDPMLGGDPSIETKVALNQDNATLEEAAANPQSFFTGYSDPKITRSYRRFNQKDIVTYNHTYFDGYQVHTEFISPFRNPLPLAGSDAAQFKPMSTPSDTQYAFIDSLYRIGELTYDSTIQKFGFEAYRYRISDRMLASTEEYPPNANFYQAFSGLVNLSFMGPPLFASKNHFLGAKDNWTDLIQVYDRTGTHPQTASQYDETEVVIEPKTGAPFTATIYLQTNVYLQQDLLFTHPARMLPLFTIYRSGNMTASTADDLLGDLRTALAAPTKLIFLSLFGIVFTVFATVFCTMKRKRVEMSSSLLSSTHEETEKERREQLIE